MFLYLACSVRLVDLVKWMSFFVLFCFLNRLLHFSPLIKVNPAAFQSGRSLCQCPANLCWAFDSDPSGSQMPRVHLFFSLVFLALTFIPSILHTSSFYLRRLHLSCSDCSILLILSSTLLALVLSLSSSRSASLSVFLLPFRGLRGRAEGEDPLQQEGQRSDPTFWREPGSARSVLHVFFIPLDNRQLLKYLKVMPVIWLERSCLNVSLKNGSYFCFLSVSSHESPQRSKGFW